MHNDPMCKDLVVRLEDLLAYFDQMATGYERIASNDEDSVSATERAKALRIAHSFFSASAANGIDHTTPECAAQNRNGGLDDSSTASVASLAQRRRRQGEH